MVEEIDKMIDAMSDEELTVFVDSIMTEPDMVQTALEVSVRVMIEFISGLGLEEELVGAILPNEMVAIIVSSQALAGKKES